MIRKTDLYDQSPKRMLHVAPENSLAYAFKKIGNLDYLSGDLFRPHAMVKMDITDIHYPDNTFDVVYCSHVLEHVPADRLAMRQMYRVLKPFGWAIINVPITEGPTLEDPRGTDRTTRKRLYGDSDHVRLYGLDYADRLRDAGFKVRIFQLEEILGMTNHIRLGILPGQVIFFCRKQ